jgi:hypothetical protein
MSKHVVRVRNRPPVEFANKGEVNAADKAALASPTGREEGRPDDDDAPLSDFEQELRDQQTIAPPMNEVEHAPQLGSPYEDEDGLDDVERALRDAAEGPTGRRELGK